jgi:hypothetical protein
LPPSPATAKATGPDGTVSSLSHYPRKVLPISRPELTHGIAIAILPRRPIPPKEFGPPPLAEHSSHDSSRMACRKVAKCFAQSRTFAGLNHSHMARATWSICIIPAFRNHALTRNYRRQFALHMAAHSFSPHRYSEAARSSSCRSRESRDSFTAHTSES